MVDDRRRETEEADALSLDPQAAPDRVGVYERPQAPAWRSSTLVWILIALTLLALLTVALIVIF